MCYRFQFIPARSGCFPSSSGENAFPSRDSSWEFGRTGRKEISGGNERPFPYSPLAAPRDVFFFVFVFVFVFLYPQERHPILSHWWSGEAHFGYTARAALRRAILKHFELHHIAVLHHLSRLRCSPQNAISPRVAQQMTREMCAASLIVVVVVVVAEREGFWFLTRSSSVGSAPPLSLLPLPPFLRLIQFEQKKKTRARCQPVPLLPSSSAA